MAMKRPHKLSLSLSNVLGLVHSKHRRMEAFWKHLPMTSALGTGKRTHTGAGNITSHGLREIG